MEAVKDRLWKGAIHTRIKFKDAEFLLRVHRNDYFPLHFVELVDFFSALTSTTLSGHPVWLEYEGTPLKWNLPVGVLHDLLYLPTRDDTCANAWLLTLKSAQDEPYPSDDIIPFDSDNSSIDYSGTANRVVINQIKQSCYVMNGNSRAVMSLSEENTRALWRAITQHDYTVVNHINKVLFGAKQPQRVPVKIYLSGSSVLFQAPIQPQDENGNLTTLGTVLKTHMPDYFSGTRTVAAYVQGIDVDVLFDVPVIDIWTVFRHLDNFLYVIVIASS